MAQKGFFKPKNPNKYKGDPTCIVYRSSYELKFMSYLDLHPEVVSWSSEEFTIPYRSPVDQRIHRYFPDFWVKKKDGTVLVIEVKPEKETIKPTPQGKRKKTFIQEAVTYAINQKKWEAAREYCEDRKWKFEIFTEKQLGIPQRSNGKSTASKSKHR
jgi:TnsA endonuclease N terminal